MNPAGGFGRSADWYRNLQAAPPVEVVVGRDRFRPVHRRRPRLGRRRVRMSASNRAGDGGLRRPERPLLERPAAPVLGKAHDPQVAVLPVDWIAVPDLHPRQLASAVKIVASTSVPGVRPARS